jgi:hypothetical protein
MCKVWENEPLSCQMFIIKENVREGDAREEEGDIMHVTQGRDTLKIFSTMKIGCKPVKMLVDSGASCNVNPANMSPDRQQ